MMSAEATPSPRLIETLIITSEERCIKMIRPHLAPYTAENVYNLRKYYIAFSSLPKTVERISQYLEYAREFPHRYLEAEGDPERNYFCDFLILEICKFYVTLGNKTYNEYKKDLEKHLQDSFINVLETLIPLSYNKPETSRFPLHTIVCPLMESMDPATIPSFKYKMMRNCYMKRLQNPFRCHSDSWVFEDDYDVINSYTFDFIFTTFIHSTLDFVVIYPYMMPVLQIMLHVNAQFYD